MLTSPIKSTLNKRRSFFFFLTRAALVYFPFSSGISVSFFFRLPLFFMSSLFFFFFAFLLSKACFSETLLFISKKKKEGKHPACRGSCSSRLNTMLWRWNTTSCLKQGAFFPLSLFIFLFLPLLLLLFFFFFFLTDSFLHIREKTVCGEWEPELKKKKRRHSQQFGLLSCVNCFLSRSCAVSLFFFFWKESV